MPLYIYPLAFLIFAAFYNFCTLQKIKEKIALFPAFVLLALMLMGQNYGIDINAYRQYYNEIEVANFWKHHVEMGYAVLMALNKLLGFNFNVFLFVLNSLLFLSVYKTFDRYSRYFALSWLLFFSLYAGYFYTILRQGLALVFTIYSLRYIVEGKRNRYLFFCFLAILCHYSAVFFLPAYWIAQRNPLSLKNVSVILFVLFPLVLIDTTPILYKIANMVGVNPFYVDLYLDSQSEMHEWAGISFGLFVKFIFFYAFAISYNRKNILERVLYNLNFFYLVLYLPLSSISMLSARGLDYYKIFECITITYAIYNQKNIIIKFLLALFVSLYAIYATIDNFSIIKEFDSMLQTILG